MGIISDEFEDMIGDEEYYAEGSVYDWCLHNRERGQLLIDEWNDEKNRSDFGMSTAMQEIMIDSVKKYWWICKGCGKEFSMSTYQRIVMGQGCSICGHIRGGIKNSLNAARDGESFLDWCLKNGDFGKLLMQEWDSEKNEMRMDEISINSRIKVDFICSTCSKPYKKQIFRRIQYGTGCKECKSSGSSFPEKYIYMALKQIYPDIISRGKAFGKVEYDICIPSEKFCIEYSGDYWHDGHEESDSMKRELCDEYGVKYLEIIEHEKGSMWDFSDARIEFTRSDRIVDQLNLIIEYIVKMMGHTLNEIDLQKAIFDANRVVYLPVDNNIKKTHPELLKEWLPEKNNGLTPDCFSAGTKKIITFTCCNCGKDNDVSLHSRTRFRSACPHCGYSVFDGKIHKMSIKHSETADVMYPELLDEWLDELNDGHSLSEFTVGMGFEATWKCVKCDNIWTRKLRERIYDKTGCRKCGYNVFDGKIHKRAIKIKPQINNRAFL